MSASTKKARYQITNWKTYNESLVQRGSITFWFDEEAVQNWEHLNQESKVGRPFTYSDSAIECVLVIRELFRLPYRQTEGLARSLVELMQLEITVPDYTSLAKRAAKLQIMLSVIPRKGNIDVVIDSTGLKVFGDGEWKVRQHGTSKRRTWRKLHLSVDPKTREILAETLTENSGHDSQQVADVLDPIERPIKSCAGDGAYDTWAVYKYLEQRGIAPLIPPQKNAKVKRNGNSKLPPLPRDEAIRGIRDQGRKAWKRQVGYHRRSLAETTMFRLKTIFGDTLKNRKLPNQKTEAHLRCKILNRMTKLGLPKFKWN
jgi:Transposase DDE domain